MAFYPSKTSNNLTQDAVIKQGDIYLQKYEYESDTNATLDLTTATAAVLTINDTVSWSDDLYNSTMAYNLLVIDDNGVVGKYKIDDTAESGGDWTLTFDSTAGILESDGTTTPSLTDEGTYQIKVLTPSDVSAVGDFLGYAVDINFTADMEKVEFEYGVPASVKYTDVIRVSSMIEGSISQIANEDVLKAIYNATEYGASADKVALAIGSNTGAFSRYRVTIATQDRSGTDMYIKVINGEFKPTGGLSMSELDYKKLPFEIKAFSDNFYPENADMVLISETA